MFQISFGSLVTCFLTIVILTAYLYYILNKSRSGFKYHIKIVFVLLALIMIRMILPMNFPFTYSIYGTKIMNLAGKLVYYDLTEDIMIFDVFLVIWIVGALVQIIRYFISRKKVYAILKTNIVPKETLKQFDSVFQEPELRKFQIACIPENVIPSIFGIIHPIIILPKEELSSEDLKFILRHEVQHYRYYDLHLKVILDLLVAVHWWNPFVYSLRSKFNIAMEFSNDYMVSKQMSEKEKLSYAESLLSIAKSRVTNKQYDLALVDQSYLSERIHMLIDDDVITKRKNTISMGLNVLFVIVIMSLSLVVVPETLYQKEAEKDWKEEDTFSIISDDTYIVNSPDGYQLYVDGKFAGTLKNIPEDFKEVPIYEENSK